MADFSSFTHKWRAAPVGGHQNEGNKVNKRNRQPVSCAPCRNRKLKCDRGHPCDACTKRGDEDSCLYGKTAVAATTRRDDSKPTSKAQERLRHLEELVKQMIGPDKSEPTPLTPPNDDQPAPEGTLNKDVNGITYTGSTHWASILNQIQELKDTLSTSSPSDEQVPPQAEPATTISLFGARSAPPLHVILQKYLPAREDCNRHLSTYFKATYMIVPFIHTYQFKRQYERFWDNQLETSPIWVSLLFSIMSIADIIRKAPLFQANNDKPKPTSPFLTASAQCLIIGNYAKSQPYIVEALAMHSQCKYAITLDPSHELGMIFSILIRHAYAMGYHREPSVFEGQLSVFEGEMRRRCFSLLRQFDLMVSFQLGLPTIMMPDSSDTKPPRHLLDEDFDEDSTVLPPPRPDTQPTQMLYLITKARLMETYGKICQHSLSFPKTPYTNADIMSLDNAITQGIDNIPLVLRARPMSLSYTDPANITMVRSNLMFLGEKARVVLHRKYMAQGANNYSHKVCIESSSKTIKHFLDLHAEFQNGGQLQEHRWMLTSFTINDFLLALMVLCLAFSIGRKNFVAAGGNADRWLQDDPSALEQFRVLERAHPVCKHYGIKAREARHVAEALGLVLSKLRPKDDEKRQQDFRNWRLTSGFMHPDPTRSVNPMMPTSDGHESGGNATTTVDPPSNGSTSDNVPPDIMPLSISNNTDVIGHGRTAIRPLHMNGNGIDPITQLPYSYSQPSMPSNTSASTTSTSSNPQFTPSSLSNSTPSYSFTPASSASTFFPQNPLAPSSIDPAAAAAAAAVAATTTTTPSSAMSWANVDMSDLIDGPLNLPNLLEGPESIDWVQFDQFLGSYGGTASSNDANQSMSLGDGDWTSGGGPEEENWGGRTGDGSGGFWGMDVV